MKKHASLLFTLLFCMVINAQNEFGKITFNKAVNISGKQRMLSQKMSKAYIYLLESPDNEKVQKELSISKVLFEKHNEILAKYSSSKETSKKIEEVNKVWLELSTLFNKTPRVSGAKKVIDMNSVLLKKANEVVESIILDAEANSQLQSDDVVENTVELKNTINLSGKQRMLAQRLALYYFANRADFDVPSVANNLKGVYISFDNAITDLLLSDFNNEKIEEVLGEAMKDWNEFKNHKEEFLNHKMDSKEVYTKTNNLTKLFNIITTQYEKIKI